MAISREIAGFSPSRADDLRKAVSKKDKVLMASLKDEFVAGSRENGIGQKVAGALWSLCEAAGDYSFNKSHAACYALLAYRTGYLKANYPAEYMAALLSTVMDTKDRVPFYVNACQDMGLAVLPPDVNASQSAFAVTGAAEIRFGLTAVKGVGEAAVAALVAERETGGEFASIWDFCRRIDHAQVNRRALESLIKSGALDSTGGSRKAMLGALADAMGKAARARHDAAAGQVNLFESLEAAAAGTVDDDPVLTSDEMDRDDLLAAEKEALGLYVSSHPLHACRNQMRRAVTCALSAIGERGDGDSVTIGGLVADAREIKTRAGAQMMFARIEDLSGSVEVVVVPAVLEQFRDLLRADTIVTVAGRVDHKGEGETKIVAQTVRAFVADASAEDDRLLLRVRPRSVGRDELGQLKRLITNHRGDVPFVIEIATGAGACERWRLDDEYSVDPDDRGLVASLKSLFGERCIAGA